MKHALCLAAAAAAFAAAAPAQLLGAPENTYFTQPTSSVLVWRTTAFRCQLIYDTTHFTNQGVVGPISIDRVRFRAANNNIAAGATYSNVNFAIGTSASDYLAPSTTFATNRGTMQQVLTAGTVVAAAGGGATPNNYVIDIPIPGGFVYNPTLGQDLILDFDATAPTPLTVPTLAAASSQTTQRVVRISQNSNTALTGTTSANAALVLFDISGGPGGVPSIAPSTSTSYGVGCYDNDSRAFAELFPIAASTLDLGGGITLLPDVTGAPTRYLVTPGAGAFVPPTTTVPVLNNAATPAAMGDDSTSAPLTLTSFAFPFPGGSTNVLHATTNGDLVLGSTTLTGSDFSPTLAEMAVTGAGVHSGRPRLFPCWYDLHGNRNATVNPLAGVHFQEDTVAQTATITWNDVGELATSTPGAKSFNFQVVLSASGAVEIRYGAMSPFGSTSQPKIVGFSPGSPVLTPGSQDFSADMPFLSKAADVARTPLSVAVAGAPVLGSTITINTSNFPAIPGIGIGFLGLTQFNPGVSLGFLGMPGCRAFASTDFTTTLVGTGTVGFTLPIPNAPSLAGFQLFSQSLAFDLSAPNAFQAITSNGVAITIGTVGG
ncbi:MAG: hypothetical protein ACK5AL_01505 [Planctomycetota bacterium]